MKKMLSLLTLAVLMASPITKAASISTEDEAADLQIMINASLANSYRVTISNADMAADSDQQGRLELGGDASTPAQFDSLASIAGSGCYVVPATIGDPAVLQSYTGGVSCSYAGDGTIAGSRLLFAAQFDVKVEVAGSSRIDLTASRQSTNEPGKVPFSKSAINFNSALPSADSDGTTLSLADQGDQAMHVLHWHGEAELDGGPEFQENILVDVVLDVVGDSVGSL